MKQTVATLIPVSTFILIHILFYLAPFTHKYNILSNYIFIAHMLITLKPNKHSLVYIKGGRLDLMKMKIGMGPAQHPKGIT